MINKNQLSENERKGLSIIRNWIFHKGRNPSIRELTKEMKFGSTRSALMLVNRLIEKKILLRKDDGSLRIINNSGSERFSAKTINVPLVGTVSCGAPIFAQENIEAYFPVSSVLIHSGSKYFLLRAQGDSMDKAGISDGDILLVRQQPNAENGQVVIALIDDEATAKEFHRTTDSIILNPKSSNKTHKPIILNRDFQIQGIVVATIPNPDKL
jgi:repressor LexA